MVVPLENKLQTKWIWIWFSMSKRICLVLVALDNKIKKMKSKNMKNLKK